MSSTARRRLPLGVGSYLRRSKSKRPRLLNNNAFANFAENLCAFAVKMECCLSKAGALLLSTDLSA